MGMQAEQPLGGAGFLAALDGFLLHNGANTVGLVQSLCLKPV